MIALRTAMHIGYEKRKGVYVRDSGDVDRSTERHGVERHEKQTTVDKHLLLGLNEILPRRGWSHQSDRDIHTTNAFATLSVDEKTGKGEDVGFEIVRLHQEVKIL